jgi:hypothetical protein
MERLLGGPFVLVGELLWRTMRRTGRTLETALGPVVSFGRKSPEAAIEALNGACELLSHVSPVFLRRAQAECHRYLLFDHASPEYWALTGAIVFGKDELQASNNGQIALALVHESTHARLARCGLSAKRFGLGRVEEACLRRERAAASKFPNSVAWVEYVDTKAATLWWTREFTRKRLEARLAGPTPSRLRAALARLTALLATRNHPSGSDGQQ